VLDEVNDWLVEQGKTDRDGPVAHADPDVP
jgi:hypothetical protein